MHLAWELSQVCSCLRVPTYATSSFWTLPWLSAQTSPPRPPNLKCSPRQHLHPLPSLLFRAVGTWLVIYLFLHFLCLYSLLSPMPRIGLGTELELNQCMSNPRMSDFILYYHNQIMLSRLRTCNLGHPATHTTCPGPTLLGAVPVVSSDGKILGLTEPTVPTNLRSDSEPIRTRTPYKIMTTPKVTQKSQHTLLGG